MSNPNDKTRQAKETDSLLGGGGDSSGNGGGGGWTAPSQTYEIALDDGGRGNNNNGSGGGGGGGWAPRAPVSNSVPMLTTLYPGGGNTGGRFNTGMPVKSYSISAPGVISYLTPVQLGRQELYEILPYTAIFGLQKKERNLSRAFASYAAELDLLDGTGTGGTGGGEDQTGAGAGGATAAVSSESKSTPPPMLSDAERLHRRSHSEVLILDELEVDKDLVTTPLIFAVLVASMAQFLVGYNTGVMNAPAKVVFPGHSLTMWSLAVAAFPVGGPFGAVVAGTLADTRGRRGALLICIWTFLLGGIIQTFALDMFTIVVARFVLGFASGYSSVLVPIYLGELAPPTLRGTLGTLTQFSLVIGILFSNLLGFVFATETLWRALFAMTVLVAIGQLLCAPFLLESPRWLLNRDANSKRARVIIKKIRGLRYDYEVETEANHYITASRAQHCGQDPAEHVASKSSFLEMFFDKRVQRLVISCLLLQVAQQLCGINAVFYYSNMFFDGIISNPLVGTTVVGGVNVAATYVALLLMDTYGRRTLLLWSSGGMFFCCAIIVVALLGFLPNTVALVAVNLYVSFFEIGLGPIPWLIVAEMFDAKYVTTAMSACSQLNFTCNFIIGMVFPYMNKFMGAYSFAPFAVVLLMTFLFTLFYLPETQGTTPEELQAELARRKSATVYQSIRQENGGGGGQIYANPIDQEWKLAMEQLKADEEKAMREGHFNYGFQPIDNRNGGGTETAVHPVAGTGAASNWQSSVGGGGP